MRSMVTLLIGTTLLLGARQSLAGGPAASASIVPAHITLVGSRNGEPDARGTFSVVARDLLHVPQSDCAIVIDFSACTDLSLCADQLDAGAIVNCAAKTIRKYTNISGQVLFTVLGNSNGAGNGSAAPGLARVSGNGFFLGTIAVSALDLDGSQGVGINDLSVWLSDFGALGNPAFGRSDFDGDGGVDINDLSAWLSAYAAGGSVQGCTSSCP